VASGGAIEKELAKYLCDYSRTIPGKQQLFIGAHAKTLEIVPHQLYVLSKLWARHAQGSLWYGVDINEAITENFEVFCGSGLWYELCLIVYIDETTKNPCSTWTSRPQFFEKHPTQHPQAGWL
jgi:T-complex protein 1 subunit eta